MTLTTFCEMFTVFFVTCFVIYLGWLGYETYKERKVLKERDELLTRIGERLKKP